MVFLIETPREISGIRFYITLSTFDTGSQDVLYYLLDIIIMLLTLQFQPHLTLQ